MGEVHRQSNFTGGEIGPRFLGRRDLKAYASSLALCENMLPLPQGPIVRRPGLAHLDMIRNRLEAVPITAAMLSAPNGGDVAALVAGTGMVTTSVIGAADPHVLLEIDFGAPAMVGMIDLVDFALVEAGTGGGDPGDLPDPTPPQYPWKPSRPEYQIP
ncbi:hypothetical protein SH203_02840 [Brevundimonas sp. SH203]|uniref:hypothetical protein n=1 Tax=Brevundimonas sp. SH203 TaxID=345167 RepID=UPI0009CBB910|nr:hypothetical protein [Brevundimonas sp. SH203]GAW42424.1 hypothetical protein SH203_02840 [Brevundimonas sp. SH203]